MDHLKHLEHLTQILTEPIVNAKVLHHLLDICADAYWIWHIPTGYDYLSDGWQRLLGYGPDELPHHYDTWKNLLSEADYKIAKDNVEGHLSSRDKVPYDCKFKMRRKDGSFITVRATGAVIEWLGDDPIIMAGKLTRVKDGAK